MAKDRGIEKIKEYSGDLLEIIEKGVKQKEKVKILEAGCGYGVAMMGFVKRFGDKVEITGFNYSKEHGNKEIMKKKAIEKKIFTKAELKKIENLPKILYVDASKKLPFKDNSFDFIYSRASIYLFDDKVKFLEKCNRILKKNGIARLSVAFGKIEKDKNPHELQNAWEIWDKGRKIEPKKYFAKFKGIKYVGKDKVIYLEIRKQPKLDFKLRLVASIDFNFIWHKLIGVKSIYTTQLKFKPHWK